MTFDLPQLFVIGFSYLLILFGIAHATERGWIPESLVRHPLTYILSLGVFASATAIYGSIGLAHEYGWGFLSYYLGVASAFLFSPLVLLPLLRITRSSMHGSLADLLTYRYHSQWAGSLVTAFMLIAVLPLLALQIQAVADSVRILVGESQLFAKERPHDGMELIFCFVISLFTISFGSRHLTAHDRHNGLVVAIAFETLVKLLALLVIGGVAVWQVFGGLSGLDQWLDINPDITALLNSPMREESARSLLLIFFSATVAMPHLFHMTFAENPSIRALKVASWGLPLLLLLMSLPVLPILWAGFKLGSPLPSEYFILGVGLELKSPTLAMLTFIGGVSAASGAIIVTTLALASMTLKHLILPIYRPSPNSKRDIYRWLLWIRRILILSIILAGYLFYRIIVGQEALSSLGLAAFIATLQFFPGVLATLYWPGANRNGFIAGLIAGFTVWFFILLLPIISEFDPSFISRFYFNVVYDDIWSAATILSLGANSLIFAVVSLLTPSSAEEIAAAEFCSSDDINRPQRRSLTIHSAEEMIEQLSTVLGRLTATREVKRAMDDIRMKPSETRPLALRRLRQRVEANLSGLLGPSVANDIVNQLLPFDDNNTESDSEDINLIEVQLESYKAHLTGLAADLDNLRRYHRQTLQELPVGVCSLGQDREILMWNRSAAELTGIRTYDIIGSNLSSVPAPWNEVLSDFLDSPAGHVYKQQITIQGENRWINLHKALEGKNNAVKDGRVIVIEDATELQMLENELTHSERLASIGRLAAGVAHEIGNPITGIACLAQNLRYDTENPESLETAREILTQTERVSKIVQTLVNFAHAGTDAQRREMTAVNVKACAEEALDLLRLNKDAKAVHFLNHCIDEAFVHADKQLLLQVFINLLSNARDASNEGSEIVIDCHIRQRQVLINVTDSGSGISGAHQDKIFEPFFTTKEAGSGTGLGLWLVYSIIDDLNGFIGVESPVAETGCGTRFTIRLNSPPQAAEVENL